MSALSRRAEPVTDGVRAPSPSGHLLFGKEKLMHDNINEVPTSGLRARSMAGAVGAIALLALAGGCTAQTSDVEQVGATRQALDSENGLSVNGLSNNGLSNNGLSAAGVGSAAFSTWFTANNDGRAAQLMHYVIRCALPSGASITYTDSGGVQHTWEGVLGLAPLWAAGSAIPLAEQQLMSACLAAHVNRLGWNVPLSVLGVKSNGSLIPLDVGESATYTVPEGCFFGNLFNNQGIFSATDPSGIGRDGATSGRQCAQQGAPNCTPLTNLQTACSDICTRASGSSTVWASCTHGGVSYAAITTRLRPQDIFACGDGICQATESCYDENTDTGCYDDCGACR